MIECPTNRNKCPPSVDQRELSPSRNCLVPNRVGKGLRGYESILEFCQQKLPVACQELSRHLSLYSTPRSSTKENALDSLYIHRTRQARSCHCPSGGTDSRSVQGPA